MNNSILKTCSFTGHRPEAFPWKDNKEDDRMKCLLARLEKAIDTVIAEGVTHFICGNAKGVDTWAAEIVIEKKKAHPELFLEIALPFEGHNASVPEVKAVCDAADLVHVVSDSDYYKSAYHERNRYMVNNSRYLVAVYDDLSGSKSGTYKTLSYAQSKGKKVIQIPWMDIK